MILTIVTVRGMIPFLVIGCTIHFGLLLLMLLSGIIFCITSRILHFYDCFPIRLSRPFVVTLASRDTGLAQTFLSIDIRKKHASRKWQKRSIFCCPLYNSGSIPKDLGNESHDNFSQRKVQHEQGALDLYPYLDGGNDIDSFFCLRSLNGGSLFPSGMRQLGHFTSLRQS
jgi:hypothetical protein